MTKKVYILQAEEEHEDWKDNWLVAAYEDLEKAKEHCRLCLDWLMLNRFNEHNPWDKNLNKRIYGNFYFYTVRQVEVFDHLNTYLGDS